MGKREGKGGRSEVPIGAVLVAALLAPSCAAPGGGGPAARSRPVEAAGDPPAASSGDSREDATARLVARLDRFAVGGAVRTDEGLLLPEIITVEIRSQVCVESRRPGTRFWSLDYDTCFTWADVDTVDDRGEYSLEVPCIDADRTYESRHGFGDLRLVQRGPVSFLASSDAGWQHQETFASSRYQRRDLVLTLDTEELWTLEDETPMREAPREDAPLIRSFPFGTAVDVVRFSQGWAEVRKDRRIGWIGLDHLGTESEMNEKAPFKKRPEPKPPRSGS